MIVVKESNEPLVSISKYCSNFVNGLEPSRKRREPVLYLRLTVAKMLGKASELLPRDIKFIVTDAWRSPELQEHYFNLYYRKFKKQYPRWDEEKLKAYTSKFAINPEDETRAGHLTGAAVDLGLFKNGRRMPMKSLGLEFSKRAQTNSEQLQAHINRNRKQLFSVMTKVGFINYPAEYWHYSYGDVMWAELSEQKAAIYGKVHSPQGT